jgi:uncharacterized repeat protein (TIGR01451 family)
MTLNALFTGLQLLFSKSTPKRRRAERRKRHQSGAEALEARTLLTNNFLAGTAFIDANTNGQLDTNESYIVGATIELYNADGTSLLATTTTDSFGSYLFNETNVPGLQPGIYRIVEVPISGYVNSGVQILSDLNPAIGIGNNTIQVALIDPTALEVSFDSSEFFALNRWEVVSSSLFGSTTVNALGQIPASVSGPGLTTAVEFYTFCVDFFNQLGDGFQTYDVEVGVDLTGPNSTPNGGRIAYLFNHYGRTLVSGGFTGNTPSVEAVGLQMAIYELIYDPSNLDLTGGNYIASYSPPYDSFTSPAEFADALSAANTFMADSASKSENAVFLNRPTFPAAPEETFSQSVIISGSLNFANIPAAIIGDYVWLDTNRDGQQGPAALEPPISGVTVNLLDSTGTTVLQTTSTNGSGLYSFTVAPGTYVVQVIAPAGAYSSFTTANVNPDGTDSDVNPATGKTGPITVVSGQTDNTNDAGLLPIDLELSKSVNNPTPLVGSNVTFTLTLVNNNAGPGVSTATGVTVSDPLPAGLSFVSASASQGSYNSGTGLWTVGTLAPGASVTLSIVATVTSGGTKTNYTQVSSANQLDVDSQPNNNPGPTPTQDDEAVVSLTPPAIIGDYVWLDTNRDGQQGPAALEPPISGVTVNLLDSTGMTVLQTTSTNGSGLYSFTVAPGTYVVQVIAPAGAYSSFTTANVNPDGTDSDVNPATGKTGPITVVSGQTDNTNDAGLLPIDLELSKSVNNPTPLVGSNVTFTLTLVNNNAGPGVSTATGVTVSDPLPAGLSFVSASASQGSYNSGTGLWTVGTLAPGASVTLSIVATVTNGGTKTNYTQVSAANQLDVDSQPNNNPGPTPTQDDEAVVSLTPPAIIGDYVWLDTNRDGQQGPAALEPPISGVTVNLLDSTGTTVLQTTSTNGSGLYSFTVAPGTYVVQVIAPAGAYSSFTTANVNPDGTDSDVNPATGKTGPITVVSGQTDNTNDAGLLPIDLELSKSVNNPTPLVGSNVTFTLTLVNNNAGPGVSTATGVTVSDPLPAGLSFVSASASQGSYNSGTGLWTVGTLAPGASVTLSIVATVTSGGTKTNYTQVSSANQFDVDSQPNNNPGPTPTQDDEAVVSLTPPAIIGDYVWLDTNRDGQQGPAALEPPISGVTVNLLDSTGTTVLQTTSTNGSGLYSFTVAPGTYVVQVIAPAGAYSSFTTANVNPDGTDSDVNPATGKTGPITVVSGQTDNTNDAGLLPIDLELSKSVNNPTPLVGSNVTFTLTLVNNNAGPGVSTATGVTVSDPLPAGLSFVSASASQGSYNSGTGLWTVGTLAPGASVTLSIVATVTNGGTKTNYTQVSSANQLDVDSQPNNNPGPTPTQDDEAVVSLTPPQLLPGIDIEKTTNGPSNTNSTAPNYDNEDAANGAGVPLLLAGGSVTWTYQVTNTGNVSFAANEVVLTDDNGTPGNTADDFSTTGGSIIFVSVQTGDADNILEPGEVWLYQATGVVQNLSGSSGSAVTFNFSGSSELDGTDGNVRSFNAGSVAVKTKAFSREKGANGAWTSAYLGSYGGGLGVTDSSEGNGSGDAHTVDNAGRDNYVLFAFDQSVIVDSAYLGYVVTDSDIQVWIGTISGAYGSLPTLSDSVLSSLGFTEVNLTSSSSARWADINNGNYAGNVLIIAADTTDTSPEDRFKIEKVKVSPAVSGIYANIGTVNVPGATDSDRSHYKNSVAPPAVPGIDIEKTTNGPSNTNSTAPNYDNEDAANGAGVPLLLAGGSVTWTYQVTNTGNVSFAANEVVLTDDNGTPGNTADDFSTTGGSIIFVSVQTGDADNVLEPGEVWLYQATGVVQNLSGSSGSAVTFDFSGNSAGDGTDGNVRSFSAGSVAVKTKAFSREKGVNGAWTSAYLGSFGGGLGVTDSSEGNGSNNMHTVDNVGRDNYVLFAFDQSVIVDSTFLGYVVDDSDIKVWIGTISGAYGSLPTLSDSVLSSLGFTEVNLTSSSSARWADINNGSYAGNVLIIAADTTDTSPEDRFKIEKIKVSPAVSGIYANIGTVTVPGATDSDRSHYRNSTTEIDYTKFYVVNSSSSDKTYEYKPNGEPVESYGLNSGNTNPRGIATTVDGDIVWVVDGNKRVYVYDTSGGLLGSWSAGSLPSGAVVEDITTDGTDVWIVDAYSDKVYKYAGAAGRRSGSQNAASSFSLNSGNRSPKGLVTDGTSIWVVNDSTTDKVFRYSVSGTFQGSWTISSQNSSPTGITINPGNVGDIWIVDACTNRVYEYTGATTRTYGSQSAATSFALAAGNTCPQGIADPPPQAASGNLAHQSYTNESAGMSLAGQMVNRITSLFSSTVRTLNKLQSTDSASKDFTSVVGETRSELNIGQSLRQKTAKSGSADFKNAADIQVSAWKIAELYEQHADTDAIFADWKTDPLELLATLK